MDSIDLMFIGMIEDEEDEMKSEVEAECFEDVYTSNPHIEEEETS
jgi:hypothetical protein